MYKSCLFREHLLLLIQHYGEYIGAEGDGAILDVISSFSRDEKDLDYVKFIVFDLSRITKISLNDSDRARIHIFEKNLLKLITQKGGVSATIFREVRIIHILPEDLGCRETYLERVRRGARNSRTLDTSETSVENTADAARKVHLVSLPNLLNGV